MTDTSGNRTDLLSKPPGELPDDAYGEQAARERQLAEGPQLPEAGGRGPLTRPSERPSEPVTAGLSQGPGAGPSSGDITTYDRIKAAYAVLPSESLRRMLEMMERQIAQGR
jgi:hypothetical protein